MEVEAPVRVLELVRVQVLVLALVRELVLVVEEEVLAQPERMLR